MRKLFFLLPIVAGAVFLTGCDDRTYRERTVVVGGGPSYYGDSDDFYYVSSRPYSRTYGQLYLRGGRYYYSRGGSYVVYNRTSNYRGDRSRYVVRDGRYRGGDRRDRIEDRRDDRRDRIEDRRDDRRDRIEDRRDDRRDHRSDRVRIQPRTTQTRQQAQFQQTRFDVRGPRVDQQRQTEVNRNVRPSRVERGDGRAQGQGGERRKKKDRDEREN
ncbi:MAG: hypothetical protein EOP84_08860 [Verrucomicrobiaceae bacterium]|nr:MAG: hypothetical protein EOP84_08860 [Verrucomicrobiaceae bacterium]